MKRLDGVFGTLFALAVAVLSSAAQAKIVTLYVVKSIRTNGSVS